MEVLNVATRTFFFLLCLWDYRSKVSIYGEENMTLF